MGEMGPFIWCGVGHEGGFEMAMEPLHQTVCLKVVGCGLQ